MTLYAAAISAYRDTEGCTQIGLHPLVVRHDTEELAKESALACARGELYPVTDGWRDHFVALQDIFDIETQRIWYEQLTIQQEEEKETREEPSFARTRDDWLHWRAEQTVNSLTSGGRDTLIDHITEALKDALEEQNKHAKP